eukprot:3183967-Pyramimonas_sp.AAC.1
METAEWSAKRRCAFFPRVASLQGIQARGSKQLPWAQLADTLGMLASSQLRPLTREGDSSNSISTKHFCQKCIAAHHAELMKLQGLAVFNSTLFGATYANVRSV